MLNVTTNYTTIGTSVKNGIHQLTTKFMVGEILWYTWIDNVAATDICEVH
jgi:hypothetical protein